MNLVIEAVLSEDSSLFSYMILEYDKEFISDIHENITTIKKDSPLTFKLGDGFLKCTQGVYYTIRRQVKISEIEDKKFSINDGNFDKTKSTFDLIDCKMHIDSGFCFFTGKTVKNKHKVEYQSVNFDRITLERMIEEG
jgi:hypothetical protein